MPMVDILTQYGSGLGGSLSLDFLTFQFSLAECLVAYRRDFQDLRECWTFYRFQAFVIAFFSFILFPSQLGSISFTILPLVSTLPYSTSFISSLISETIQSFSLCQEVGSGRHCCYVHMLQLWFSSHISAISRARPVGFLRKSRIKITVAIDLTSNTISWLEYLFVLGSINWVWKVKQGVTRWQGWTHCIGLLGIPLMGIWVAQDTIQVWP